MITKKQPTRTCIACKNKNDKKNLIRIVKNNDEIKLDFTGKLNGRGAYICYSLECLEKAIKTKKLEKALEIKLSEEIYEQIKETIVNKIGGDVIG
mgnify:CR=1 FL=1